MSRSLILGLTLAVTAGVARAEEKRPAPKPVDVVICLDVSNSMDGLIASARQKLWDMATERVESGKTLRGQENVDAKAPSLADE